jgi:hypothetical protein
MILTRRGLCQRLANAGALAVVAIAAACSGGSYVSSGGSPVAAPTNVTGTSDTSGISAGAALQAPGDTPTPKP